MLGRFIFSVFTVVLFSRNIRIEAKDYNSSVISHYDSNLLVFIAITSGPAHTLVLVYIILLIFFTILLLRMYRHLRHENRNTWIKGCTQSNNASKLNNLKEPSTCAYKFFVDVANPSVPLHEELATYQDLVFRNVCSLMERHPVDVHYGTNSGLKSFNNFLNFYLIAIIQYNN